jgi:hypothetical protein
MTVAFLDGNGDHFTLTHTIDLEREPEPFFSFDLRTTPERCQAKVGSSLDLAYNVANPSEAFANSGELASKARVFRAYGVDFAVLVATLLITHRRDALATIGWVVWLIAFCVGIFLGSTGWCHRWGYPTLQRLCCSSYRPQSLCCLVCPLSGGGSGLDGGSSLSAQRFPWLRLLQRGHRSKLLEPLSFRPVPNGKPLSCLARQYYGDGCAKCDW